MAEASTPMRADAARALEEQAALRRVATLVARDASCETLRAGLGEEIARLVGADAVLMLRFDAGGAVTALSVWGEAETPDPRLTVARETGRPVTLDAAAGVPIAVDGRVWGLLVASATRPERFAADAADRMAAFANLAATGIANQLARTELRLLVDEQAGLRRVAELVARGASPEAVFTVVAEELHRLVGGTAALHRGAEGDGTASAPILVDGRPWGTLSVAFTEPGCAPADAEPRIARFAELIGTAVANAAAQAELQLLIDEQRALRRVAVLVARGASQPEVFDTIAMEASRLLDGVATALLRYEPDGGAVVVAVRGGTGWVGMRVPAEGEGVTAQVRRSGRVARIDSGAGAPELGLGAAVGAPIAVEGRLWGLIAAMTRTQPLRAGAEDRLAQFAEVAAGAIANAESREALTASRARIAATADQDRRRIQRDVHDGAQQRLVHTIITLKMARSALGDAAGPALELLDESLENAQRATAELHEIVRGIGPATIVSGGLRSGIESLAGRICLPVEVDVTAEPLPPPLEATAYFVLTEGLTNVVKHAGAATARVRAVVDGNALRLEVCDDGTGGADPARGSGLVGLGDRVAACGGTITISSPPGAGTTIAAELPLAG